MEFGKNNTPFSEDEFAQRLSSTKQAMEAAGLDVLIVCDPANMNYLTGYDGWSFYVHQAVIVALSLDKPFWVGRNQDVNGAHLTTVLPEENVIGYADEYVQSMTRHPMQVVASTIAERGLGSGRIGVEADSYYFTARAQAVLVQELPDAVFSDAGVLVNWLRSVKSDAEIALIRQAARITERIMQRAVDLIDVGVPQSEVAAAILETGVRGIPGEGGYGGDYPAIMPLMPSGVGTSCPHITWRDEPFLAQTGTTVEIAGVRHRYHAPMSRTVYLGTPPQKMLDAAKIVDEGIDAALAAARPGATAHDVYAAWSAVIARYGIFKESRCGYSFGLNYPPDWGERTLSLRAGDETVLHPNMTIHFMPGLWLDDWGIEISEPIRITQSDVEQFCTFSRELVVK
ncbi:ectoine utilization protein EutD [Rhodopseudomonas julia]|uniref:Ectoine utilization protein EutD n=1 Tax=Rhodopseudomonas julia TaxID=200617 RepID=A0ABU0CBX9_9BRAD|nr:M24 family metallopeptidase [Rhodopseudomonas julia]MDQ0327125.1 ectoine utilization protein EutD [Rhodopseudomonas julia]